MRFTLRQLEYFVAAGETGSVTRASGRVNISQASISAAISHLEAEFGVQLFIRHHAQGLSLTPAGQQFLVKARALIEQAEEFQTVAGELSNRVTGPLDVGCLVTLYPLIIPELVHVFHLRHPEAQVKVTAAHQETLFERLRRGQISLALTYDLEIPGDIALEPLAKLTPYAFFAADHPLAGRKTVRLEDLAEEPLILLDLPLSRDYFVSLFYHAGITPRIHAEFEHLEVIRSLVARGYGYSLANIRPKNRFALDGRPLVYVSLEGEHRPLSIGLATLKAQRDTRVASAFGALARELIRDGSIPGMD